MRRQTEIKNFGRHESKRKEQRRTDKTQSRCQADVQNKHQCHIFLLRHTYRIIVNEPNLVTMIYGATT